MRSLKWVLPAGLYVFLCFPATGQVHYKGFEQLAPNIRTAFTSKYAATSEERWSKVEDLIKISFRSGDEYYDAFFDRNGKWLSTEFAIGFEQLPEKVQHSLNTGEFSNWHKGSVLKVELPGSGELYRIYLYGKNWDEMEVNFDKSGKQVI